MTPEFPMLSSEFVRWETANDPKNPMYLLTFCTQDVDTSDGAPFQMKLTFTGDQMGKLLANGISAMASSGDATAAAMLKLLRRADDPRGQRLRFDSHGKDNEN